jgi:N-sulfoglucosamine sulfohydrolase
MSSTHKNVLFLIADDWSRLAACYGNEAVKTPRIDAFARAGVVFDNAFCTSPSCAVSRACILTGQHSHTHGQYGHCHGFQGFSTHAHMNSTPHSLRSAGFATACIGKKHVEPTSVYPFEYEPHVNSRSPAELAQAARTFLNDNTDRPFYLHVGFSDPHRAGRGFANDKTWPGVTEVPYRPEDIVVPDFLPDIPEVRADLADYYQAVSRFDHGIGLLLDVLDESGRADETLVIVTTDHAMPFPGAKASFFDSGHHCPFILRTPDLETPGVHHQALINWTNIRPTIHDWTNVPAPKDLPERSLLPILAEPEATGWDETYFSHCFHEVVDYNPYRVLRGRRYKFVRNIASGHQSPLPTDLFRSVSWTAVREQNVQKMGLRETPRVLKREPEELYNIEVDPMETTNLIGNPDLAEIESAMREKLLTFRRDTKDPWLEVDFQEGRIDDPSI